MIIYSVMYDGERWWLDKQENGNHYQEELSEKINPDQKHIQESSHGWSLHYRMRGQRKDRISSAYTHHYYAQLDLVASRLNNPDCVSVYLMGDDNIKMEFYK